MTQTALAPLTINISEEAAGHVRVFAEQSGLPDSNLRVSVKGGGLRRDDLRPRSRR